MLKAEAGCAVFWELVQAANPVRRIKLPSPWIACCMLSTINHCSATAAGEGVRVPGALWQRAMPPGLVAAIERAAATAPG